MVDDGLRQVQGGRAKYAMGGGTILAARWRHRPSFDIDIIVSPDTPLHKADDPNQSDFNRRMMEAGGKPAYSPELDKYKIAFAGGSEIDLWATAPIFGTADRRERVEGREQSVLSSAQILRGKLERAEMDLVRDVADVIAAARNDPESLEAAVNSMPRAMGEYIAGPGTTRTRFSTKRRRRHFAGPTTGNRTSGTSAARGPELFRPPCTTHWR